VILKHLIQLFNRVAEEDPEKFKEIQAVYNNVFKIGAVEDIKNQKKLVSLARFTTNQRENTSLDEYINNKRKGQSQIFYVADISKTHEQLAKSVFVEKLEARGYEVLLLNHPMDEVLFSNLRKWKSLSFQDVAKSGLKFGDEDVDAEEEKERGEEMKEKFEPLIRYLSSHASSEFRNVVVSNRLVTSSCAVIADTFGYTANVQKLLNSHGRDRGPHAEFMRKQKILEINPNSPLIEGLLNRVKQLPSEEEEKDVEAEEELKEVVSILIDGALVRSGFDVPDSNEFFIRMDRVLRRSLGVSQSATTDTQVKPAPPIDAKLPEEDQIEESDLPINIDIPQHSEQITFGFDGEPTEEGSIHDEL